MGILGALLAPRLIERVPTGWLTVAVAWSFVPLVVPMALWNHPVAVAAALGVGVLLNPAGNAGISSYRLTLTPPALQGRSRGLGGEVAVLALGGLAALVALLPTLSASVRTVPQPARGPRRTPSSRRPRASRPDR